MSAAIPGGLPRAGDGIPMTDDCNDPGLRSFIDVPPDSHFPIQNLPFGFFRRKGGIGLSELGVAIGEYVLGLTELNRAGVLSKEGDSPVWRDYDIAFPRLLGNRQFISSLRQRVSRLLRDSEPTLRKNKKLRERAFLLQKDVEMDLPCYISNYTDFYSSREHATNVGIMLRGKDNALMPNWLHLPVAYHGRASSVVVSGTDIRRPLGQTKADDANAPTFGPSRSLDFELELGMFIGQQNVLGQPISTAKAPEHVFGMVLVNDWSARDVQ